jgi:hypothetical protein
VMALQRRGTCTSPLRGPPVEHATARNYLNRARAKHLPLSSRPMVRKGRDWVAIALATAGVLAALSLAGIFIVYLVDTIGGDDSSSSAQTSGTTSPTGGTAPTTPRPGASAPGAGASAPGAGGAGGAGAGNAAGGGQGAASAGGQRSNLIPDNQQYETFTSRSQRYSISYPKGWEEAGEDERKRWVFRLDGLNVFMARGPKPTVDDVRVQLGRQDFRIVVPPKEVKLNGRPVIKATLSERREKPGGGRALILIDTYRMANKGRTATVNISCPQGVYKPNKDAFTKMAESFRWL